MKVNVPQTSSDSKHPNEIAAELDEATAQTYGLLTLLQHAALNPPEAGPWSDQVQCGIIELSGSTRDRLFAAAEGVRSFIIHAQPSA